MRLAALTAAFLLPTLASGGATVRADPGDLQPRRGERLIVMSADRVSDGRALQTEAEGSVRKVGQGPAVADGRSEGAIKEKPSPKQ